jgi:glucose-6-phosphate isomerase
MNNMTPRICEPGFRLDATYMDLPHDLLREAAQDLERAFEEMAALEAGAIANPDEGRQVGHYWLRAPERAPTPEIAAAIASTVSRIEAFAARVHAGEVRGERGLLRNLLLIGIGGSALGPQLCAAALSRPGQDRMTPFFIDNTDPDGIAHTLAKVRGTTAGLDGTLVIVTSKSGGTKETRNGMLEVEAAYRRAGLSFARHAVAVTSEGSALDNYRAAKGWLDVFPMWDWVGGRTSELSAVGLLPAALQGLDIRGLLSGAAQMDEWTRRRGAEAGRNPAALLALCWRHAAQLGRRDMVVLPYKDRLELFSRYLQQLVMESLGKERDRGGGVVQQGIAVYGNKGSTDQHAYVQQLRDGLNNFFATFIEVLRDQEGEGLQVEEGITSGDYLLGFLLGTRRALHENGRLSLTVTVPDVSARSLGMLIALFERAVGFYASFYNINAYHQPGVEAGKVAAAGVLALQRKLVAVLPPSAVEARCASELAEAAGQAAEVDVAAEILAHLAANGRAQSTGEADPRQARYWR